MSVVIDVIVKYDVNCIVNCKEEVYSLATPAKLTECIRSKLVSFSFKCMEFNSNKN